MFCVGEHRYVDRRHNILNEWVSLGSLLQLLRMRNEWVNQWMIETSYAVARICTVMWRLSDDWAILPLTTSRHYTYLQCEYTTHYRPHTICTSPAMFRKSGEWSSEWSAWTLRRLHYVTYVVACVNIWRPHHLSGLCGSSLRYFLHIYITECTRTHCRSLPQMCAKCAFESTSRGETWMNDWVSRWVNEREKE